MPCYFFDIHDEIDLVDLDGMELKSLEHAKGEALRALASMGQELVLACGPQKNLVIVVRDDAGDTVLTVTVQFSVEPPI